jgi:hypothetical protein
MRETLHLIGRELIAGARKRFEHLLEKQRLERDGNVMLRCDVHAPSLAAVYCRDVAGL